VNFTPVAKIFLNKHMKKYVPSIIHIDRLDLAVSSDFVRLGSLTVFQGRTYRTCRIQVCVG
jgi:hypothetical protein